MAAVVVVGGVVAVVVVMVVALVRRWVDDARRRGEGPLGRAWGAWRDATGSAASSRHHGHDDEAEERVEFQRDKAMIYRRERMASHADSEKHQRLVWLAAVKRETRVRDYAPALALAGEALSREEVAESAAERERVRVGEMQLERPLKEYTLATTAAKARTRKMLAAWSATACSLSTTELAKRNMRCMQSSGGFISSRKEFAPGHELPMGQSPFRADVARGLARMFESRYVVELDAQAGQLGFALAQESPHIKWSGYDDAVNVEVFTRGYVHWSDYRVAPLVLSRGPADVVVSVQVPVDDVSGRTAAWWESLTSNAWCCVVLATRAPGLARVQGELAARGFTRRVDVEREFLGHVDVRGDGDVVNVVACRTEWTDEAHQAACEAALPPDGELFVALEAAAARVNHQKGSGV